VCHKIFFICSFVASLATPTSVDVHVLPTLEFSLLYDSHKNLLTVHLQRAYNLESSTDSSRCTTSVVLYLLPNKLEVFESPVIQNCLNPEYNKFFIFSGLTGSEAVRKQTLVFRILEHTGLVVNNSERGLSHSVCIFYLIGILAMCLV